MVIFHFSDFPLQKNTKIRKYDHKRAKSFFDIFIVKMIIKVCRHIFK